MKEISIDKYNYYIKLYKGVDFDDNQIKYFQSKYLLRSSYMVGEIHIKVDIDIFIYKREDEWYLIYYCFPHNKSRGFICDGFDELKKNLEGYGKNII